MIDTLKRFTQESLFDATAHLLSKLNIQFDREIAEPIDVAELHDGPMPQYLTDALDSIDHTYFIGIVNDLSLQGNRTDEDLEAITRMMQRGDKYDGMFIFACDAKSGANLTRTAAAALTRAFNRIACANPVILVIRQGDFLSLATCERLEYSQQWRQGTGEKIGKVCILRNINCSHPHRGHVDILSSLGDKIYPSFEELYKHWMEVFSSELLTKKFYSELSDWYAWAVQVARFPNDLNTREDDDKFNHEACIRLITRLIFVWFLKQKKLIPEEFFDEKYIRENLIDNFNPHDRENLLYNPEKSRYYRLVLQNLFFAMLNCPIVAEGKDVANNRRFIRVSFHGKNPDYNINNIMRYEQEFAPGGADKFIELANNNVPFLNGGLFDCLDDKPNGLYYDGFSERRESLEQLYLPDYLFFGEEVGRSIDLSKWYGDKNKKSVSARGIIDILKRYAFTIEENTPLDQEVSLDPELLGKVFENLLAAVNPDTMITARKQTGSFYTPREIVQYMVDESLVAHLKRICGNELEPEYRRLLSYATDETPLNDEQRKAVMQALYNCRVLDPACGSGAFPMGILQQMVHLLRQLDPTNEMWKEFMIDRAIEKSKVAFGAEREEERRARLDDIENAFNRSINDPDYARKLYLIEHCIYGVDIQPIAVQISKLRFFISLVVDQKPTTDATHNFGIRPLPNLESKFVAANSLNPIDYDANLVDGAAKVREYKIQLKEFNHKIFLIKRNSDKEKLRKRIKETRQDLAKAIEDTGFVTNSAAQQLAAWDMFDQNASSSFFDAEWMFGVKNGFDIYIGNPPYNGISENNGDKIRLLIEDYKKEPGTQKALNERKLWLQDDYVKFIRAFENHIERSEYGILAFINNSSFIDNPTFRGMRWHLLSTFDRITIFDLHGNTRKNNIESSENKDENVFNIMQGVSINIFEKGTSTRSNCLATLHHSEIIGPRSLKLSILGKASANEIKFSTVVPALPFLMFKPQTRDGIEQYETGFRITDLMEIYATGVTTARDGLVIDIDKDELLAKINMFADLSIEDDAIRSHFFGNKKSPKYPPGDSRGWKMSQARRIIQKYNHREKIIPFAFRILDNRYIYYSSDMVDWGRENVYCHVVSHDNICLAVPRQTSKVWRHVFVSDKVANFNFLATGGQNGAGTQFPLYIYNNESRVANLNNIIWNRIKELIGESCNAEDVFDYIYGILHSPSYRSKYNEFLKCDFPRIPYPQNKDEFYHYVYYGNKLRNLHLFHDIPDDVTIATFSCNGDNYVQRIVYSNERVYINQYQYFDNVSEDIWEMQIGDDQPAKRWLKERKGRTLSAADIRFYKSIAYILFKTKEIMGIIDQ